VAFAEVPEHEVTPALLFQVSHSCGSSITLTWRVKCFFGIHLILLVQAIKLDPGSTRMRLLVLRHVAEQGSACETPRLTPPLQPSGAGKAERREQVP